MKKIVLVAGISILVLVVGFLGYSYIDYASREKRIAEATVEIERSCVELVSAFLERHGLTSSLESLENQLSSHNLKTFKKCQASLANLSIDVRRDKTEYKIMYTNFEGDSIIKTFDPQGY